ncbi:pyruvate dehydrogenase (acetyl-transferring) E1 component subunit alpha [Raineyella antarctica]
MIGLLGPDGVRVEDADHAYRGTDTDIAGALRDMVMTRRLDAEGTALQRQGQLGLWPPTLGQEAVGVGTMHAMKPSDMCFPTYREHGAALMRGVDPVDIMSLFRGVDMGGWDPIATRFNRYAIVIGSQPLHAVGWAMGLQLEGLTGNGKADDGAVLAFFGDGASAQGDVNEALVWAASYKAPVVFIVTNNQWAISVPTTRQTVVPLARRGEGFGIPGVRVDGNDVLAVQAVTEAALARARHGGGPQLIEMFTYRMGAHTTSDDPTKYRSRAEEDRWRAKDPIERVRTYLMRAGAIDEAWLDALQVEVDDFAADLRARTLALDPPDFADWFDQVYAEQTDELAEQQQAYRTYAASFDDEEVRR